MLVNLSLKEITETKVQKHSISDIDGYREIMKWKKQADTGLECSTFK